MQFLEIIGVVILGTLISLASAGGVGGGEVVVPTISIFFGFKLSQTPPLAQLSILAGAIGRFVLNY